MSERESAYKAEAWRMTDYYPDSYAKFMSSLGIGIDYDDGDYSRYESQFRADLAAHDARIASEAAERALREAAEDCAQAFLARQHGEVARMAAEAIYSTLHARADRLRAEREGAGEGGA